MAEKQQVEVINKGTNPVPVTISGNGASNRPSIIPYSFNHTLGSGTPFVLSDSMPQYMWTIELIVLSSLEDNGFLTFDVLHENQVLLTLIINLTRNGTSFFTKMRIKEDNRIRMTMSRAVCNIHISGYYEFIPRI
jgi:hypothetical protein